MSSQVLFPAVTVDASSQAFFDAARDGRLVLQRCLQCDTNQLGCEICQQCFGTEFAWVPASGGGFIHALVVMHLAYHAAFVPPYRSAIVELEEGPRLPVLLEGFASAQVGQAVVIAFVPAENATLVPVARCVT